MLANQASNYLVSGTAPERLGNAHPNIAPYQVFSTKDGYVVIAVGNDGQFAAFARAIGADELSSDGRYRTNRSRVANRGALNAAIAPRMRNRTTAEWLDLMERATVPAGPINTIDAVFDDPHVAVRGMTGPINRIDAGGRRMVLHPVKFSKTPAIAEGAPPVLGSHTEEVLREVADADEIGALKKRGVIG
jgi:crotonobetainyl-CoA:carnitine CoA-transferase CaiB-like acyl-CoA transferase